MISPGPSSPPLKQTRKGFVPALKAPFCGLGQQMAGTDHNIKGGALSNLGLKPGKEYYSREFPFSRLLAAGIKGGKGLKVSIKEGRSAAEAKF